MAPHALPQSARPGAGIGDAAVSLDRRKRAGVSIAGGIHSDAGTRQELAARRGLREVEMGGDYVYTSIYFAYFFFTVMAGGALAYFFRFMYGETTHEDRGALVRQMNAATEASAILMYLVAAMVIVFGVVVVAFALRKSH